MVMIKADNIDCVADTYSYICTSYHSYSLAMCVVALGSLRARGMISRCMHPFPEARSVLSLSLWRAGAIKSSRERRQSMASQTNKRSGRETKAEKREEEEKAMESTTLSYLKLVAPLVLSVLALTANGEEYSLLQLIFYLVTLCYIIVIIIIIT